MRLQGCRYDTEAYYEIRPDVECGGCCGWGHIEAQCSRTAARCGLCAEEHETKAHRRPVEGCQAKKGHWCKHTVAKCGNCRGPHFAQANACPKKRAARSDAKGWRSPSPTWRQRGKTSLPEEPPTGAQETPRGEMEMEKEHETALEEAMEEQGHRERPGGRGVG